MRRNRRTQRAPPGLPQRQCGHHAAPHLGTESRPPFSIMNKYLINNNIDLVIINHLICLLSPSTVWTFWRGTSTATARWPMPDRPAVRSAWTLWLNTAVRTSVTRSWPRPTSHAATPTATTAAAASGAPRSYDEPLRQLQTPRDKTEAQFGKIWIGLGTTICHKHKPRPLDTMGESSAGWWETQSSLRKRLKQESRRRPNAVPHQTAHTTTDSQPEAPEKSKHIEEKHHHEGKGEEPMRMSPSEAFHLLTIFFFFTGFCTILL